MFMSVEEPMTPEEIAKDFNLPLDAVNEAIAYCQSAPPEIAQDFEREERLVAASNHGTEIPAREVARILGK
jgi:hypothetical protein